ncbi:MAG: SgcJ/EcaC family oxidoreductase [Pseudomonadota bacterium]
MAENSSAVEATLRRYGSAVNDGDFEAWISLWEEDGRQMPADAPARVGVAAIREAMQPVFEALNLDFQMHSIDDVEVFGDVALTRCTYSIHATPKAGGETFPVMADGKALTLFKRQSNDSWKIVYDCVNANTPA